MLYQLGRANGAEAGTPEPPTIALPFVAAELVALGEVLPTEDELPRLPNPAALTSRPDQVTLEPQRQEQRPVEVSEGPNEDDQYPEETARDTTRHNDDRPVNQDPQPGRADGFLGGTSLSESARANLFGRTQQQIQRAFAPPASIPAEELSRLEGTVEIFVNEEGRVLSHRWISRSGNRLFDSAVDRAINAFHLGSQRLYLPTGNADAMRLVLTQGFRITVRP